METSTSAKLTSLSSSPRSTLSWKDDWGGYEGASRDSFVTKSESASTSEVHPRGTRTPPQAREPRPEWSTSTSELELTCPSREEINSIEAVDRWRSRRSSTPSDLVNFNGNEDGADEERGRSQPLEGRPWDSKATGSRPAYRVLAGTSSAGASGHETEEYSEDTAGDDSCSVASSSASAPVAVDLHEALPGGIQFFGSLSDELVCLKLCAKRALEVGKKAQRFAAAEVAKVQTEKNHVESVAENFAKVNHDLRRQVLMLRDKNRKLKSERQLETLALHHEREELQKERDSLLRVIQNEKKQRKKLQSEKDAALSSLQEDRMRMKAEREANAVALQEERAKLDAMEVERDKAVKALEDGTQTLDAERDAMLAAMRDMTSRLDIEREDKARLMRRSNMDFFNMRSPDKKLAKGKNIRNWP